MALNISKKGESYKLVDTITDSLVLDKESFTEFEVKENLIIRHLYNFLQDVIKIDMDFPNGFYIDNKYHNLKEVRFSEWMLVYGKKDSDIWKTSIEILKKYKVNLQYGE